LRCIQYALSPSGTSRCVNQAFGRAELAPQAVEPRLGRFAITEFRGVSNYSCQCPRGVPWITKIKLSHGRYVGVFVFRLHHVHAKCRNFIMTQIDHISTLAVAPTGSSAPDSITLANGDIWVVYTNGADSTVGSQHHRRI
jgi:hypothetical protein